MKNIVAVFLLSISFIQSALSAPPSTYQYSPPSFCTDGKVGGANFGVVYYPEYLPYPVPVYWDDSISLKVENHIPINKKITVKSDGTIFSSSNERIYFFDSLGGYRGTDKANKWGNAYFSYTVSEIIRSGTGPGFVWIMKDLNSRPTCIKRKVYFQHAPTISANIKESTTPDKSSLIFYLYGTQDTSFSKNALSGQPVKYDLERKTLSKWNGQYCNVVEDQTSFETVLSSTFSSSVSTSHRNCEELYRVRSFDGSLYSNWEYYRSSNNHKRSNGSGGEAGGGSGGRSGGGSCRVRCNSER